MAFDAQERINQLYGPMEQEAVKKAMEHVKAGTAEVNETLSRNTGIPPYHFSEGPNGVFLMPEPESEEYFKLGRGNEVYRIPNLFKSGTMGIYVEAKNRKKFIGIKPKFLEGPYNKEKLNEYKEAIYVARLLRKKTKIGSDERNFLNDYIRIAKEEIRLMENPRKTARYVLTHEPTHHALSAIGVAQKISTEMNEAFTENIAEDIRGYSLLGPGAYYTALKNWARKTFGGKDGIYQKIGNLAEVPGF